MNETFICRCAAFSASLSWRRRPSRVATESERKLVAGHVGGLVLSHDRALALYERARIATQSQYWMLAVMVGFTTFGLWLLSQANQ